MKNFVISPTGRLHVEGGCAFMVARDKWSAKPPHGDLVRCGRKKGEHPVRGFSRWVNHRTYIPAPFARAVEVSDGEPSQAPLVAAPEVPQPVDAMEGVGQPSGADAPQ